MAANTDKVAVVEIDGLWFRVQKLKGRRGFRGTRALQVILGARGYLMISSPKFWDAEEPDQLSALLQLEAAAGANYDDAEQAMVELLAFDKGQGARYRESAPIEAAPSKGWIPIRSMETLDTYEQVDHKTWQALRWEMIKLCYRPTSAATGTSDAIPAAATTSTQTSSPSGSRTKPATGTPKAPSLNSGFSGG